MSDTHDFSETNTARLIRAGCSPDARPDPAARERVFLRLETEMRAEASLAPFPGKALGLLAAVGCVLAAWALFRIGAMGVHVLEDMTWLALALPLCVNLALTPVASLIIITQRRKYGKA